MSHRHLPVRPRLDQLQQQATDFLRAIASGDAVAIEELREHHPQPVQPGSATLDDAQLVLARSYGVGNWPRLVVACHLIDAIWRDDVDTIRTMVAERPALLHGMACGTQSCNWGPPMLYAANLGRERIIDALLELGAVDLESALMRATLQGQIGTARKLHDTAGRPLMLKDAAMGPAEALSAAGMALVLELGGAISDDEGDWRGPVALTLETYSRNREDKHKILELMTDNGIQLPDTAPMAVHRGRMISSNAICTAIRNYCCGRLARRDLSAGTRLWRRRPVGRLPRRSKGRPCCTCALNTMNARLPTGSSLGEWPPTRRPQSMETGLEGTRRSLRRWSRSRTVCGTRIRHIRATTSPGCCSTVAPTRTHGRLSASGTTTIACCTSTVEVTPLAWGQRYHASARPATRQCVWWPNEEGVPDEAGQQGRPQRLLECFRKS